MARRMAVRRRITELIESTTAVSVTISSTASSAAITADMAVMLSPQA